MTAVQTSLRTDLTLASRSSATPSRPVRPGLPSIPWAFILKVTVDAAGFFTAALLAAAATTSVAAEVVGLCAAMAAVRASFLAVCGAYRLSWRHVSMRDALNLLPVLLGPTASLWLAAYSIGFRGVGPTLLLEGLLAAGSAYAGRIAVRWLDESRAYGQRRASSAGVPARRVLLVGAGRTGRLAARELRQRPDAGYDAVGFLDDDCTLIGRRIEGLAVLGTTHDARSVADRLGVDCIILTLPSATRAQRRAAVARCSDAGLDVRTVPGYCELLTGKVELTRIRPVRIDELLGRDVVDIDRDRWSAVVESIAGRRVLVTGAGGSIGSELCRQIAALGPDRLVLVENNENNLFDIEGEVRGVLGDQAIPCLVDVRDEASVKRVFAHHRPQVVFHAAAFKHVPMMELHASSAIENNVFGTSVVVRAAESVGVDRFLFVSTDKAVNPANVMGASKRMAEMVVQAHAAQSRGKYCCVRFGNVLGSRGSVLHTFQRQIEAGGPVTVTHPEVTRFFMTIPEAVRLLIQSNAVQQGGEVFLLDMGEPVKIVDLARQMIQLSGLELEEVPISFVGLRPGEKLYEELLRDEEGAEPSLVEGVFHARLAPVNPQTLSTWLKPLRAAADEHDDAAIRKILAIAAAYRPDPSAAPVPEGLPAIKPRSAAA